MYLEKIKRLIQVKKDGVLYIISSSLYYVFPQLHILKILTNKLYYLSTITNKSIQFCALIFYHCYICRSCTNLDAHHGTVMREKKLDIAFLKLVQLQNKVHEHLKGYCQCAPWHTFYDCPRAISSSTNYKAWFYRIP